VQRVDVELTPPYAVHVGAGALALAASELPAPAALITEPHVHGLHGDALAVPTATPSHLVPRGEDSKTFAELERVLDFLAALALDRDATLLTLGGGAVTDLGGMAAALYARGIAVAHCPTTLLAQVDASVGGKTAVNLAAGKNLAGVFHQPVLVLADTAVLATLSGAELASGLGEVAKTALIDGEETLRLVEERAPALLARDADALEEVVAACVRVKARVVRADEREAGPRRALNLGHTFGHGIEHALGYGAVPHGVAVAAGIGLALAMAEERGILEDPALAPRAVALLRALGLPTGLADVAALAGRPLDPDAVARAMRHDKKARAGAPRFVLPVAAGRLELDAEVAEPELAAFLESQVRS
jgi:3-dehydroquinate synthase